VEKISDIWSKLLGRFVETALYVCTLIFGKKCLLWKKPYFFSSVSGTERELSERSSSVCNRVVKAAFNMSTKIFWWTLKKLRFYTFSGFQEINAGFFRNYLRQGIENENPRVQRTFFENIRSIQKIESPIHSDFIKKLPQYRRTFSAVLIK